jgi:serine/threonine protein kinase
VPKMTLSTLSTHLNQRFDEISAATEWVEGYRPGGYHAVHFGDSFGRYRVLRKLGYGSFATVWLARDKK